ncbi:hypothetical protein [Sphingobacterium anhuiense]|uniref:hypothetical protein n=1 Tax=Sphingobacterium anhuiense TaxID=493780 RepID=UPI003C2B8AB7
MIIKNNKVSVDQAISKGKRMVNYPIVIIILTTLGISFYLCIHLSFWIVPIGFVFAVAFSWIWWSIMITKWRLWAFDNVRNVHELKKRAIQEKLIWPDDVIFNKTEISNATEKEKWNVLKQKFEYEDIFQDDLSIPDETNIFFSKSKSSLHLLIMLIVLGCGIFIIMDNNYIPGFIIVALGLYFTIREFLKMINKLPQITINADGIKTISTDFYNWNEIKNEEVIDESSGKYIRHYLTYEHPNGIEQLLINDYAMDKSSLNKLLILYRGRNNQKAKTLNMHKS